MIQRNLTIGRWWVEFYFCPDGYDIDAILDRMYDFGAPVERMRQALELMEHGGPDKGFTFSNPFERVAMIVIGPTSSGDEFLDSMVHELHHLAVHIASALGIDLKGEGPAYIGGDSARELADVICRLGCNKCRKGV